jgi:hypothetical protein
VDAVNPMSGSTQRVDPVDPVVPKSESIFTVTQRNPLRVDSVDLKSGSIERVGSVDPGSGSSGSKEWIQWIQTIQ